MKKKLLFVYVFISLMSFAQQSITFSVEELSKPQKLLPQKTLEGIYQSLIFQDLGMTYEKVDKDICNIIAQSHVSDSLVTFGYHSFFYGMYQAYADHRPFVLSPDMIWLLISQGFTQHVQAKHEELRHYFVKHQGKMSLIVSSDRVSLNNSNTEDWETIFPAFNMQIASYTGDSLIDLLTADFSTTSMVEKIVSQITIMKAMESYFEFIVISLVCGIPEITLQGTTEDWQKVLDKTKQLAKYDLRWWTKELEPILEEFIKASKGDIDTTFWRNMFKYHSSKNYGIPQIIDGWVVTFFPYDKDGIRNNLKELNDEKSLPEEIVKVNISYFDEKIRQTIPLELWAGFVGLKQNKENFALTPKISWMIRKKDVGNLSQKRRLKELSKDSFEGINIRVKEVPEHLLELKEIERLNIVFVDKIIIPNELGKIKIKVLTLSGKIDKSEIKRIRGMFPDTELLINAKYIPR